MASRIYSIIIIAILAISCASCNLPGQEGAPGQPNIQDTAVFATAQAMVQATLAAMITPTEPYTETPAVTNTVPPPVFTDTPTLEPTTAFTPTPEIPQVSVSVETNCRTGPGRIYDWIGSLREGEKAEVVARSSVSGYWYIKNPDRSGGCWLWGEYATVTGNTDALPVYTPPPTPTPTFTPTPFPDFKVKFTGIDNCTGWFAEFEIDVTGQAKLDSYTISTKDKNTDTTVKNSSNDFEKLNGCIVDESDGELKGDDIGWVNSGSFDYDPDGNDLTATITICSEDDLDGVCVTKVVDFKP
jgi:uncharacterized protein YgiM (DUF1202 family)